MADDHEGIVEELRRRGVTRRDFLRFCGATAALLGLPGSAAAQIAKDLGAAKKPILVWLEFQDCAGNTESLLRASRPTVGSLVLDTISLDYHETVMAAAGAHAEQALDGVVSRSGGEYIAVVEGAIPLAENGVYCCIGGRTAIEIATRVCGKAAATIAMGTCATHGGIPAAAPNPTGAVGVMEALPGLANVVNLTACPANVENLTALVVYYLTFKRWPPLDHERRPMFANAKLIHDACERRAHFNAGQFVEAWGDEGHRAGYCLYKMGCKGPATFYNCPGVRWNEGTSWPVKSGHGCIGCAEPKFWDRMTPFHEHLPISAGIGSNVDKVGIAATGVVAAAFAAHGVSSLAKRYAQRQLPRDESARPPPRKPEGE